MLIFDLDGTLIDSNAVWREVDEKFLSRRNKPFTDEYADFVAHSIFPIAARFTKEYYALPDSEEAIMAEWLELAREAYAFHVPLKPYAREFLEHCRQKGEQMVLFTAGVPELGELALKRLGLEEYFSALHYAQEMGMEKREPEAFLAVAGHHGVRPEDCTVFEDSPRNCAAAVSAGFTVVGVYDRFYESFWPDVQKYSTRSILGFHELL